MHFNNLSLDISVLAGWYVNLYLPVHSCFYIYKFIGLLISYVSIQKQNIDGATEPNKILAFSNYKIKFYFIFVKLLKSRENLAYFDLIHPLPDDH